MIDIVRILFNDFMCSWRGHKPLPFTINRYLGGHFLSVDCFKCARCKMCLPPAKVRK